MPVPVRRARKRRAAYLEKAGVNVLGQAREADVFFVVPTIIAGTGQAIKRPLCMDTTSFKGRAPCVKKGWSVKGQRKW